MKKILSLIFLLVSNISFAELKIAILDTGKPYQSRAPICENGHFNALDVNVDRKVHKNKDLSIFDSNGHSSHISDLIYQHAGDTGYCLTYFKYYLKESTDMSANLERFNASLRRIHAQKFDVVVIAGGGYWADSTERNYVKAILNKGTKIVAAAGNDGKDIDKEYYYPASYDERIIVVGAKPIYFNKVINGERRSVLTPIYNQGLKTIDRYEQGYQVSAQVNGKEVWLNGTSQATGIAAGKIIKELLNETK